MAEVDLGLRIDEVTSFKREIHFGTWDDVNRTKWRGLCANLLDPLSHFKETQARLRDQLKAFDELKEDPERINKADEIQIELSQFRSTLGSPAKGQIVVPNETSSQDTVSIELLDRRLKAAEKELGQLRLAVDALQAIMGTRQVGADS